MIMDNDLDDIDDPALPCITSFKQIEDYLASGALDTDKVTAVWVTEVKCGMCGVIWDCGGVVWEQTGETRFDRHGVQREVGVMYLPEGTRCMLIDDGRALLQTHLDEVHPGWRFVIDGDHNTRSLNARRCGRRHQR